MAATITKVSEDGSVWLTISPPGVTPFPLQHPVSMGGPEGTTPTPGGWTWVPRV